MDEDTYRQDTVNFSRPQIGRRVISAHAENLGTVYKEDEVQECSLEPSTPFGPRIQRVTSVQEIKVNERLWYISCLKETSSKACWAYMAVSKKECESRIVQNGKAIPAPIYTRIWQPP